MHSRLLSKIWDTQTHRQTDTTVYRVVPQLKIQIENVVMKMKSKMKSKLNQNIGMSVSIAVVNTVQK